jgi:hypothetical protein
MHAHDMTLMITTNLCAYYKVRGNALKRTAPTKQLYSQCDNLRSQIELPAQSPFANTFDKLKRAAQNINWPQKSVFA